MCSTAGDTFIPEGTSQLGEKKDKHPTVAATGEVPGSTSNIRQSIRVETASGARLNLVGPGVTMGGWPLGKGGFATWHKRDLPLYHLKKESGVDGTHE